MREDWIETALEELLDYIQPTSYIVDSTEYNNAYKTPVLTAGKSFVLGYTNEKHNIFSDLPVIIFDDFTTATQFVNFKFKVKSSAMKILIPKSYLVNLKYVYYYMQTIRHNSDTHKRYWISSYSKLSIKLAPLPEQSAIITKVEELFSELDSGIANLNNAKNKLEIFRQAVLKKAFEGELTSTKDIEWVTLGEVCVDVEYGTSAKSQNEGLVPVIRMGNIQNGKIDWNDLKYSSCKAEINQYRLQKGDVLFNRTNSAEHVGKTAIYKSEKEAIFAGYLIRINYDKDTLNGDYLNYYLNSYTAKKYGNSVKSYGVNQSNINGTKLKKYPFPKTSITNQISIVNEIETRLSVYENAIDNINKSLRNTEYLKQSILKEAFEGKFLSEAEIEACKKKPDWEPAEKLLYKIKNELRAVK